MAPERDVAGTDDPFDDLASELEGCDPLLLALAEERHGAECIFPWRTATDAHKGAWVRRAREGR